MRSSEDPRRDVRSFARLSMYRKIGIHRRIAVSLSAYTDNEPAGWSPTLSVTFPKSFVDAETRHHLEQLARREKLDALDRDRSMDRAALKLALARMMRAVGPRADSGSKKKTDSSGVPSVPMPRSKIEDTSTLRPPGSDTNLAHGDIKVSSDQRNSHDGATVENSHRKPGGHVCPGKLCERMIAGRQF